MGTCLEISPSVLHQIKQWQGIRRYQITFKCHLGHRFQAYISVDQESYKIWHWLKSSYHEQYFNEILFYLSALQSFLELTIEFQFISSFDIKKSQNLSVCICFFLFLIQKQWKELSKEDLCPVFDHSPTKLMNEKYNGNRIGLEEEKLTGDRYTGLSSKMQDTVEENSER